nr:MAG TPA: hypothetical protein [Caudoviricetes sp.]
MILVTHLVTLFFLNVKKQIGHNPTNPYYSFALSCIPDAFLTTINHF